MFTRAPRRLLAFSSLFVSVMPAAAQPYRVVDLGSFDRGNRAPAIVADIDETARIVGRAPGLRADRAFLWNLGRLIDLGSLIPENLSGANALNGLGVVAGWAEISHGISHAVAWTGNQVIDLGTLGGMSSEALGINRDNWIVGWAEDAMGQERGFVYRNSAMIDIGALPGANECRAVAVDSFGRVAATSRDSNGNYRAVIWENGLMASLGTLPGGRSSHAYAMNDRQQVVGSSEASGSFARAFVFEGDFQGGTLTDLGTLGGSRSYAYDINNYGVIVGVAEPLSGGLRACIWIDGQPRDLNEMISPWSGWRIDVARSINDSGYIAAQATIDASERGVLLIPTPMYFDEPIPGLAGQVNTFTASGATPGAAVRLLYSAQRGFGRPPGCPAAIVELAAPTLAASATADSEGIVTFELPIPRQVRGRTFVFQMIEVAGCHLSQPVPCTFR
ncbi:MAG: DUF3466 family protein [Phycisphaerales bacterium]|nr:DUF3466 family protein [Phycisphaerales bacterium]